MEVWLNTNKDMCLKIPVVNAFKLIEALNRNKNANKEAKQIGKKIEDFLLEALF